MTEMVVPLPGGARPRRRRIGAWRVLRLLLVTPLAWAAIALLAAAWFSGALVDLDLDPELVEFAAAGIAVAAAALTLWAALEWLGLSRRLRDSRSELAGLMGIVAVVTTLPVLAIAALLFQKAPIIGRNAAAGRQLTFVMERPAGSHVLRIRGFTGRGFAERLNLLAAAPGLERVEIDSPGGLIDEASKAAQLIESRKLEVVVRRTCASACMIVLMSADRRLADYDAAIAIHAAGAVSDGDDPLVSVGVRAQERRSDQYMVAHGMPRALLEEAEKVGNGKMVALPAAEALEQGILTGLLDGERPVTLEEARRRTGPIHKTVMSARD